MDIVQKAEEGQLIVKVQRPIYSSASKYHQLLIYDEARSIEGEIPADEETIEDLFQAHQYKVFAVGTLIEGEYGLEIELEALLDEDYWPNW